MKHLLIAAMIMVAATAHATETDDLTELEKARTASFVFKAELFLGCNQPFDMPEGGIPKERPAFVQEWLREDSSKIGKSKSGKIQKKRMEAFLKTIASLSDAENKPEWKGKEVEEVAKLINADLRRIAEAAGVTLGSDKKTQNK